MQGLLSLIHNTRPDLYNCSGQNTQSLEEPQLRNVIVGVLYVVLGLFYQAIYFPCIIVMFRPNLLKHSSFKIMLFLGIIDLICLTVCADIAGILSITGVTYCNAPTLFRITGSVALGTWTGGCAYFVLLALDRFTDIFLPRLRLFKDNRTWIWCIVPGIDALYFIFFEKPVIYDSRLNAFFFDPHLNDGMEYPADALVFHNFTVMFFVVTIYGSISLRLVYHNKNRRRRQIPPMQKQVILQSFILCVMNVGTGTLYVFMQYKNLHLALYLLGQICWQTCHGCIAMIYLTMNHTVKMNVISLFGLENLPREKPVIRSNQKELQDTRMDIYGIATCSTSRSKYEFLSEQNVIDLVEANLEFKHNNE